ncbi:MAG: ATP-binding protein [Candidatus Sericytochromatia bacterium]
MSNAWSPDSALYAKALASSPTRIWCIPDLDQGEVWLPADFQQMLGYAENQLCQREQLLAWGHPDDLANCLQQRDAAIVSGEPASLLLRLRHQELGFRWFEVHMQYHPGPPRQLVGTLSDVHERVLLQTRLERSEQLLHQISDMGHVGGWRLDLQTRQTAWSDAVYEIHDLPLGMSPGLDEAIAFYPPDSRCKLEQAMARALASGEPWDLELPLITARGRQIWVRTLGQIQYDPHTPGVARELWGVIQDISARKIQEQRQQQLHDFQESLHQLATRLTLSRQQWLDQSLEMLCQVLDLPAGAVSYVHHQLSELQALHDHARPDVLKRFQVGTSMPLAGSFVSQIYAQEGTFTWNELAEESPERGQLLSKMGLKTMIGSRFWIQDEPAGVVACYGYHESKVFSDIEQDMLSYFARWLGFMLERSQQIERLERLSLTQQQMLEIVAHDLRNPLANIQGVYWMLERKVAQGNMPESSHLDLIKHSVDQANRLVAELLEVTDLEHPQADLVLTPAPLFDWLHEISESFSHRARKRQITLTCHNESGPLRVPFHAAKLTRALENLLHNALKFTPPHGQITLKLTQEGAFACLSVTDTGVGIPAELQNQLFAKFTPARRKGLHGESSHGLGLYIVSEIVKLHRGQLSVRSEAGQGCRFEIRLPLLADLNDPADTPSV